jgi:hypothetical protein
MLDPMSGHVGFVVDKVAIPPTQHHPHSEVTSVLASHSPLSSRVALGSDVTAVPSETRTAPPNSYLLKKL